MAISNSKRRNHTLLPMVAGLVCGAFAHADGRNFYVTSVGTDNSVCGAVSTPCRSLGKALENATDGDQLVVGPGRYGDLNGNGSFADPGDEQPDFVRGCMICVDKSVRIVSKSRARTTFLDGTSPIPLYGVVMTGSKVTLDGFTITHAARGGVLVASDGGGKAELLNNVAIDNVCEGNCATTGFTVYAGNSPTNVIGNVAIGNGDGFGLQANGRGKFIVRDNKAIRNDNNGFLLSHSMPTDAYDELFVLDSLESIGNGVGYYISGNNLQFSSSVAIANRSHGFIVRGEHHRMNHLVAVFNRGAGLSLEENSGPLTFMNGTIYGNQGLSTDGRRNCGVINKSFFASEITIAAYWGAPSGQGPDPADAAGPGTGCDQSSRSKTVVVAYPAPRD
jgi:hypothetical protein